LLIDRQKYPDEISGLENTKAAGQAVPDELPKKCQAQPDLQLRSDFPAASQSCLIP